VHIQTSTEQPGEVEIYIINSQELISEQMERQFKNLLFLFSFMLAIVVGSTNYVQVGQSMLADINLKLCAISKAHIEGKALATQNNYNKALPSDAFVSASLSFMKGEYINKNYIEERVAEHQMNTSGAIITATTNYGRDGP